MSEDFDWTDDAVATLTRLWHEGESSATIAQALDGPTRNAILGKIHRLGLANIKRPKKPREPSDFAWPSGVHRYSPKRVTLPATTGPTIMSEPQPISPEPAAELTDLVPEPPRRGRRIGVMDLEPQHCRWPVEGPPDAAFCGAPRVSGYPYCAEHCRRSYVRDPRHSMAPYRQDAAE